MFLILKILSLKVIKIFTLQLIYTIAYKAFKIVQGLESEKEEFKEAKTVTVALSEKVLRVPELEKELNEKKQEVLNLKQFLHNNIMLEEMVENLKTKLLAAEEKESEVPLLKVKPFMNNFLI